MNFTWSDADTLIDILDHIWIGLVLLAVTAIPSWFSMRNHKGIVEVKQQVQNAHKTNLRDDLDRCINAIEALAHDVAGLRDDLHDERKSRKAQVDDLRSDVDRMRQR